MNQADTVVNRNITKSRDLAPQLEFDLCHGRAERRASPVKDIMGLPEVTLRQIPYPYRAMLAICSDLDETPDIATYLEIARLLNTTEMTTMGPGVGLEVGNSMYFDMPPGLLSYWNTDDAGRAAIRALIQSGHIDCLHSYGDLATTRAHAGRALDELTKYNCRLDVWVDHAVAPSNFGQDIMKGKGDEPGSEVYHADLTFGFGIRYVWRGRVTSAIGQGCPRSLRGLFRPRYFLSSGRTVAKEWLKVLLARLGSTKYAMHKGNRLIRDVQLRDGTPVKEFVRCNPHWKGVSGGDTADGLADVLTRQFLDTLTTRGGACILYTHLGKVRNSKHRISHRTQEALRLLASYEAEGKILVTTTSRLLNHVLTLRGLSVSVARGDAGLAVDINTEHGLDYLGGVSFQIPQVPVTRVLVNGRDVSGLREDRCYEGSCRIFSFPRRKLEFPTL